MPELNLAPILQKGMRVDDREWQATPRLVSNFVPTPFGIREVRWPHQLLPMEALTAKGISNLSTLQLLNLTSGVMLRGDNELYDVTSAASLNLVTVYDIYNPAVVDPTPFLNPLVGSCMDTHVSVADLGVHWFLFSNGITGALGTNPVQVFHTKWVSSAKVFSQQAIHINTGCTHRGRLLMGGFDDTTAGSTLWANWGTIWSDLLKYGTIWGYSAENPGQNWVSWGQIGGGDTVQFFLPETVQYGGDNASLRAADGQYNLDSPYMLEAFRRCESGMMPMTFNGMVLRMMPFIDGVFVYGEDGVGGLRMANTPVPTYGRIDALQCPGLLTPGAVDGNQNRQVYVGVDGNLWMIGADVSVQKIGGQEHIRDLGMLEEVSGYRQCTRVVYNHLLDEYYISTMDSKTFPSDMLVMNKNGLYIQKYGIRGVLSNPDVYTCEDGWHLHEDIPQGLVYFLGGAEVLQNGTFATAANWTFAAPWVFNTDHMEHTTAAEDTLKQTVANMVSPGWVSDLAYQLKFTLSGMGAGAYLKIFGHVFIADGTYSITFTVDDPVGPFEVIGYGTLKFDTVSIVPLSDQAATWTSGWLQPANANTKSIKEVQVVGNVGDNPLSLTVYYTNKFNGPTLSYGPVAFDDRGVAQVKIGCRQFMLSITSASGADVFIDDMIVVFDDSSRVGVSRILP